MTCAKALLFGIALAGCLRTTQDLAPFPCADDGTCPMGMTCTQQVGCATDCNLFDPELTRLGSTDESCQLALDRSGAIVSVYVPLSFASSPEPCSSDDSCYDGYACDLAATPLVCRDLCDDAHPCNSGQACTPRGNLPAHGGVCL